VRQILVVAHTGRAEAVRSAQHVIAALQRAGLGVRVLDSEAPDLACESAQVTPLESATDGVEVVVVLGGDGTLLRAAELARPSGTPVLGVNLGHVGFLAEAEQDDLALTVERLTAGDYTVEPRMTLEFTVGVDGRELGEGWALNEVSVEKADRERMLEVVTEVDGRPLSRWGCDGVVCATPTGSTAYAFSAGGPVVWPDVEALLMVPISAHALFARPLVVSPNSMLAVEVRPTPTGAVIWADGRRKVELPGGARIEVRRGSKPVQLARLAAQPFTDRLVAKFELPVRGWRGRSSQ
jgi:NAD+ kinase